MTDFPKITIVTPSFNQGQFLEKTIKSVLNQNYPNLEYIIMDGGSADNSVEIIKKYADKLTYWQSRPDGGQSAAINMGLKRGTGTIFNWLNSDDYLLPGALKQIATMYKENPDASAWLGGCEIADANGKIQRKVMPKVGPVNEIGLWGKSTHFYQPSCFFSAEKFNLCEGVKEYLHYIMDVELWMSLAQKGKFVTTSQVISGAHVYEGIKTFSNPTGKNLELITVNILHGHVDAAQELLHQANLDAAWYDKETQSEILNMLPMQTLTVHLVSTLPERIKRKFHQ